MGEPARTHRNAIRAGQRCLNIHGVECDPDGEWRRDMRAAEPTAAELRELAQQILDAYLAPDGDA